MPDKSSVPVHSLSDIHPTLRGVSLDAEQLFQSLQHTIQLCNGVNSADKLTSQLREGIEVGIHAEAGIDETRSFRDLVEQSHKYRDGLDNENLDADMPPVLLSEG